MIAEEKAGREIGETLFIHPRTVDNLRPNICQKLDLHGINSLLLRFALTLQSSFAADRYRFRFRVKIHRKICDVTRPDWGGDPIHKPAASSCPFPAV